MLQSLNILYLVEQAFNSSGAATTSPPSLSSLQVLLLGVIQYLEWAAIVFSVLFLIAFIWVRLRLEADEHQLHHERHEAELQYAEGHAEEGSNPEWERVLSLVNSSHESDWRRAILEADILLGDMLDQRGFIGENVGERLKGINSDQFPSVNAAWEAHRLRNAIAHLGEGFELTQRDVAIAMDGYRRLFEDFEFL